MLIACDAHYSIEQRTPILFAAKIRFVEIETQATFRLATCYRREKIVNMAPAFLRNCNAKWVSCLHLLAKFRLNVSRLLAAQRPPFSIFHFQFIG